MIKSILFTWNSSFNWRLKLQNSSWMAVLRELDLKWSILNPIIEFSLVSGTLMSFRWSFGSSATFSLFAHGVIYKHNFNIFDFTEANFYLMFLLSSTSLHLNFVTIKKLISAITWFQTPPPIFTTAMFKWLLTP